MVIWRSRMCAWTQDADRSKSTVSNPQLEKELAVVFRQRKAGRFATTSPSIYHTEGVKVA